MTSIKYRNANGTYATLLDVTALLNRVSALETKTNSLQGTVDALNARTSWLRLGKNCYYKKVGNIVTIVFDYCYISGGNWTTLGTLPYGYRPASTGFGEDVDKVVMSIVQRGGNNVGIMEVATSGLVKIYGTVTSDYWSGSATFPCA